jgi:hypothetical protein
MLFSTLSAVLGLGFTTVIASPVLQEKATHVTIKHDTLVPAVAGLELSVDAVSTRDVDGASTVCNNDKLEFMSDIQACIDRFFADGDAPVTVPKGGNVQMCSHGKVKVSGRALNK